MNRKRAKAVLHPFEYIYNNLLGLWEVWDKINETIHSFRNDAEEVAELATDQWDQVSKDYKDAKRYVDEGVSEYKRLWKNIREDW